MAINKDKTHISTTELAKILGVSRVTIFNKIKNGEIKAEKVGRNYVIPVEEVDQTVKKSLSSSRKAEIEGAVTKTIKEYGETLRLLGKE